jgi:hypothetical protein
MLQRKKIYYYKIKSNEKNQSNVILRFYNKVFCFSNFGFNELSNMNLLKSIDNYNHFYLNLKEETNKKGLSLSEKIIFNNTFSINNKIKMSKLKIFLTSLRYSDVNNFGFFVRFRIVGLGYRVRRIFFNNLNNINKLSRVLRFDVGYSHCIFYKMPNDVGVCVKKKKFIIYSLKPNLLSFVLYQIMKLRKLNKYKQKGILPEHLKIKLKSGKKQQR